MSNAGVTIIRGVGVILAIMPAVTAAAVPCFLVWTILGEWRDTVSQHELYRNLYGIGSLAVAVGLIGFKFVPPWLLALAPAANHGTTLLVLVWLTAVIGSTMFIGIVAYEMLPELPRLGPPRLISLVAIWLCVEVLGTLAIPALTTPTTRSRGASVLERGGQHGPPLESPSLSSPSAPSAKSPPMNLDDFFKWLKEAAAAPADTRPRAVQVEADGTLRVTQRALADELRMSKANCARRLFQLERAGKIECTSTNAGTWIRLIDGS